MEDEFVVTFFLKAFRVLVKLYCIVWPPGASKYGSEQLSYPLKNHLQEFMCCSMMLLCSTCETSLRITSCSMFLFPLQWWKVRQVFADLYDTTQQDRSSVWIWLLEKSKESVGESPVAIRFRRFVVFNHVARRQKNGTRGTGFRTIWYAIKVCLELDV